VADFMAGDARPTRITENGKLLLGQGVFWDQSRIPAAKPDDDQYGRYRKLKT
jgi:hypothetical protein